jgi:ribosome-associated protein
MTTHEDADQVTDPAITPAKTRRTKATPTKTPTTQASATSKTPTTRAVASKARAATSKVDGASPTRAPAKPRLGLPARSTALATDRRASLDIARRIVELAEDKKAAEIVLLDLGELTTLADAFVICSGGSERQLDAIADGIVSGLRDQKVRPIGREGVAASHWVLLDFGGVVVHIFTPPERDFYELEKHWSEAKTVLRVQ